MKVSIVLPVYNGAKYIEEAIKSIQAQSFSDWELLIINDGSTDGTKDILNNIPEARLKIIDNPKNLGLQASLNIGLNAAQGEYIARLDADDRWITKDKLEKQVRWLNSDSNNILIGSGFKIVDKDGKELRIVKPLVNDSEIRSNILSINPFCHSSVVFRKKEALAAGAYSQNKISRYQEDYDLWLRLGRLGKLANLPEIAVRYLDTDTGEARKNDKRHYSYFKLQVFLKHGGHYPGLFKAILKWFYYLLFY
jgi:glycosyltransferase involved in cell wall biosynthesis